MLDVPRSNGDCSFGTSPKEGTSTVKQLSEYNFQLQLHLYMFELVKHVLSLVCCYIIALPSK